MCDLDLGPEDLCDPYVRHNIIMSYKHLPIQEWQNYWTDTNIIAFDISYHDFKSKSNLDRWGDDHIHARDTSTLCQFRNDRIVGRI
jgi:hypothetical protein